MTRQLRFLAVCAVVAVGACASGVQRRVSEADILLPKKQNVISEGVRTAIAKCEAYPRASVLRAVRDRCRLGELDTLRTGGRDSVPVRKTP